MSLVTPIFELPKRRTVERAERALAPRPHTAEIIILPCIRREYLGEAPRARTAEGA